MAAEKSTAWEENYRVGYTTFEEATWRVMTNPFWPVDWDIHAQRPKQVASNSSFHVLRSQLDMDTFRRGMANVTLSGTSAPTLGAGRRGDLKWVIGTIVLAYKHEIHFAPCYLDDKHKPQIQSKMLSQPNDWDAFRALHGDYYLAGAVKAATLTLYLRTSDNAKLTSKIAGLEATGLRGMKLAWTDIQANSAKALDYHFTVDIVGCNDLQQPATELENALADPQSLSLEQTFAAVDAIDTQFVKTATGAPVTALLRNLVDLIPAMGVRNPNINENALREVGAIQNSFKTLASTIEKNLQAWEKEQDRLSETLTGIKSNYQLIINPTTVGAAYSRFEIVRRLARLREQLEDSIFVDTFMTNMAKYRNTEPIYSHWPLYGIYGSSQTWSYPIDVYLEDKPVLCSQADRSDVILTAEYTSRVFRVDGRLDLQAPRGSFIVGYTVRGDMAHNGQWWLHKGKSAIGGTVLNFRCRSARTRGDLPSNEAAYRYVVTLHTMASREKAAWCAKDPRAWTDQE